MIIRDVKNPSSQDVDEKVRECQACMVTTVTLLGWAGVVGLVLQTRGFIESAIKDGLELPVVKMNNKGKRGICGH